MRFLNFVLVAIVSFVLFLLPAKASAINIFGSGCGTANAGNSAVCKDANSQGDNNPVTGKGGVVQKAANVIAVIGGIAAVITIVVSGIMYATAGGGNTEKAQNARKVLTNSLIGLVVIALAWTIVSFVVQKVVSS